MDKTRPAYILYANVKFFTKSSYSDESMLNLLQNSFLNSGSRYDYQYKFLGLNARDLASWCLASGRLPNENDLVTFPKKHSCSLSLGDTLVMEQ